MRTSLWSPGTGYEGYETDGSGYPDEALGKEWGNGLWGLL